ncbi:hypothetical protein GJ496_008551 [Pomphorhynchus laevis]|nr:hypothetical protein GJ496_008551 [Pomphorhynchus laevis]
MTNEDHLTDLSDYRIKEKDILKMEAETLTETSGYLKLDNKLYDFILSRFPSCDIKRIDILYGWNGPHPPYCLLCNCVFNSPRNAAAHFSKFPGTKHNKRKSCTEKMKEKLTSGCTICCCELNSTIQIMGHLNSTKHARMLTVRDYVIELDFIYKQLCEVTGSCYVNNRLDDIEDLILGREWKISGIDNKDEYVHVRDYIVRELMDQLLKQVEESLKGNKCFQNMFGISIRKQDESYYQDEEPPTLPDDFVDTDFVNNLINGKMFFY